MYVSIYAQIVRVGVADASEESTYTHRSTRAHAQMIHTKRTPHIANGGGAGSLIVLLFTVSYVVCIRAKRKIQREIEKREKEKERKRLFWMFSINYCCTVFVNVMRL